MARIKSAKYEDKIINAFEVDDDYDNYLTNGFKCPKCLVKVAFNRGINYKDPHFKNWPKVKHLANCGTPKLHELNVYKDNGNADIVISTILPRADRFNNLDSVEKIRKFIKRYFGERSRKFLNSLSSLSADEIQNLELQTEDKKTVRVVDLIMRQDSIIDKLDSVDDSFVCILKGFTSKPIRIGNNVKIPMTFGGKYGNRKQFDLFVPASYYVKNEKKIDKIINKLIYCYGIPKKNKYGYKMDLYSITHQVKILEK